MFVHANFGHILGNMFTLYFFGTFLLNLVGEKKFLIIYFGGGLLGSILFLLLSPYFSLGVGASGAIFSLGGALAVLRPKVPVMIFPIPAPIPLWIAVIGGFVLLTLLSSFLSIAWQAHLGGLIFGLVAGYLIKRNTRRRYTI
jgi:membrane associated rhomboid family serine protease